MKTVTYDPRTHRLVRRDTLKRLFALREAYEDGCRWVACMSEAVAKSMNRRIERARTENL